MPFVRSSDISFVLTGKGKDAAERMTDELLSTPNPSTFTLPNKYEENKCELI